jgi:hypothetical protein
LPAETVATWLDAWQRTGANPLAANYWLRGLAWIECEVAARRKPPTAG